MHNLLKDFTHESYDLKELYKKKKRGKKETKIVVKTF